MSQLSSADLERLSRELGSYARSGVPMPAGLRQLEQNLRPGPLRETVTELAASLEQGTPLSEALARGRAGVPSDFIALVRCGELSGDLEAVLRFSVEQSRRVKRHRSAVLTAMIYPLFVFVTLMIAASLIIRYVVPKMSDSYQQLGAELPALTQFVVDVSRFLATPVGLLVILALIVFPLLLVFNRTLRERFLDRVMIFPGMRGLVALSDTALLMRFIGRMAARAVPLPDALRAASLAVLLPESRSALERMSTAAEQGHAVAPHLSPRTPSTAAWLFARAEERGDLPVVCEGIASDCEDRFERLSKRAVAVIEPVLILLVAVVIAWLLISLYLPLFVFPNIVGRP